MPRPGGGRARSSGGGERHRGGERFLRGLRLRRRGGERPARGLRLRRRGGERRRLPAGLRLRLRLRLRRLRRGGGLRSRLRERPSRRSRPSSSLPGVTRRRGGGLPRSRGSDPLLLEPLRGLCVRADTRVSEDTRASRWVCVATGRKADITSAMASPRSHQDLRASRLPRSLPLLRLLWRCCVPHRMLVRKVVAGPLRTRVGARPRASSASATAVQCWLLTATNSHSTSSSKSSRPDADGPWQLVPDSFLRRPRLVVTSPPLRHSHRCTSTAP